MSIKPTTTTTACKIMVRLRSSIVIVTTLVLLQQCVYALRGGRQQQHTDGDEAVLRQLKYQLHNNNKFAKTTTPRRLEQENVQCMVLLVQFSDHLDRELPDKQNFQDLCNGSLRNYLLEQSHGLYDINCNVFDWRVTDNTEAFYAQGTSGLGENSQAFFHPVLTAIVDENSANDFMWLPGFDTDNDGMGNSELDCLLVFHSGIAAEVGGTDCFDNAQADRIWSHGRDRSNEGYYWQDANTAISVGPYMVASAYHGTCTDKGPTQLGIVAHEYLHTLGLPDLYDPTMGFGGGTGAFGIMSFAYGPGKDGFNPGSMQPWSKQQLGWAEPVTITIDGTYTIGPSTSSIDATYVIRDVANLPPDEYFMIENRRPTGFDTHMYGDNGGIIIYHVDDSIENLQRQTGFPGQAGWPQNGNHYRVAVVQADGLYELEQGLNIGDSGDVFDKAGMALVPSSMASSIANNGASSIYPNTDSYQGGRITSTGIVIEILSDASDSMTFRVSGITSSASIPENTGSNTEVPSLVPSLDLSQMPSSTPSFNPSDTPSSAPSFIPSVGPSQTPSLIPSSSPTLILLDSTGQSAAIPTQTSGNTPSVPSQSVPALPFGVGVTIRDIDGDGN